jgi:hypothetical protein
MRVEHPLASDGDGRPPANVDVDGTTVAVADDGTFELPDGGESWLQRFAAAYDETPDALVREEDGPPDDVEAPFDPCDLTVDELESKLDEEDFSDEELAALLDSEASYKQRETALEAIDAQREE